MRAAGAVAPNSVVLLDYAAVDLALPDAVADVLLGAWEQVEQILRWRFVVFQASSFPKKNPEPGKTERVSRVEWDIYRKVLRNEPSAVGRLLYGDFGADNGKVKFQKGGGGGAPPHRMLRYTTRDEFVVRRGPDEGTRARVMREVAEATATDPAFRAYASWGDRRIEDRAKGRLGPGGPADWRAENQSQHMTFQFGLFASLLETAAAQ